MVNFVPACFMSDVPSACKEKQSFVGPCSACLGAFPSAFGALLPPMEPSSRCLHTSSPAPEVDHSLLCFFPLCIFNSLSCCHGPLCGPCLARCCPITSTVTTPPTFPHPTPSHSESHCQQNISLSPPPDRILLPHDT